MRRTLLLLGALVLPVLPAAPSYAADNVICVGSPSGVSCNENAGTITAAIGLANGNALDDVIRVGPGTFIDGPYLLMGSTHAVTLQGSGTSTVLTLAADPGQQTYVTANSATVRDLKIMMPAQADSGSDVGISAFAASTVEGVTVDGLLTANATGVRVSTSLLTDSSILMEPTANPGTRGVYLEGGNAVTDSVLSAGAGLVQSSPNATDTVLRVSMRVGYASTSSAGVTTDGGTVNIESSVIDLGTSMATGLLAQNPNNGTSDKAINANHVTIVGGGASSKGAWADSTAQGAKQLSTISLSNSIVRGPSMSLRADAGNDGAQGGDSTATVTVSYTDYQTTGGSIAPTTGAGGVVLGAGNLLDVDPQFASASDRHLKAGSPLIDKGNPTGSATGRDLDGLPRVADGDGNGSAIRDMGAYEWQDVLAPDTTISSGPSGLTNDATPTFAFASEPGATFECRVDAAAYAVCSSPFTSPGLNEGPHTFSVRAKDGAGNADATPATRSFTVDTVAPATELTVKFGKRVTKKKVKVAFSSEAGATFQCQVDGKGWKPCTSPERLTEIVRRMASALAGAA